MVIDFAGLTPPEAYQWMTSAIVPRPIAWVSTISPDGRPNLAPFSFFQGITANPPTLMFVPVNTRDGRKKDTLRNIEAVPEFVVHIVSVALAEAMNATAAMLPYGESEFAHAGLASVPSGCVRPPRVASAAVAFECTLQSITRIGEGPGAANVVFGNIVRLHVADDVLAADGSIDPGKLDAIGRLGGSDYTTTRDRFSMERP